MFAPRYTLHMVSNTRALEESPDGEIAAEANFLLLQTLVEGATSIHLAGKYHDRFVRVAGRLLLKERQVVYDTTLLANDLVYPV
jgi:3-phenylpropionate/cinnamic acid dioxygenase small subunit